LKEKKPFHHAKSVLPPVLGELQILTYKLSDMHIYKHIFIHNYKNECSLATFAKQTGEEVFLSREPLLL